METTKIVVKYPINTEENYAREMEFYLFTDSRSSNCLFSKNEAFW